MKTEKVYVDPNNARGIFEDSELVGKILSVRYIFPYSAEFLVTENSNQQKRAEVIRRHPITPKCVQVVNAEYYAGKSLQFNLIKTVREGDANYQKYERKLQEVKI